MFEKYFQSSIKWLKTKSGKSAILALVVSVLFSIGIFVLVKNIGPETLQRYVDSSGIWAPLVFIVIHIITILVSPFGGGGAIVISSGVFFGFVGGFIYFALGALIGASLNYYLAKKYGLPLIKKIVGNENAIQVEKIVTRITDSNLLVIVTLMSTAAFNLLCYSAGLSKMGYKKFIAGVIISTAINTPIYIAIGAAIVQPNGFYEGIVVILIILALISISFEYFRKKKKANTQRNTFD